MNYEHSVLIRIADALETIAARFDPEKRREQMKRERLESKWNDIEAIRKWLMNATRECRVRLGGSSWNDIIKAAARKLYRVGYKPGQPMPEISVGSTWTPRWNKLIAASGIRCFRLTTSTE